jgi:hypothetical protein
MKLALLTASLLLASLTLSARAEDKTVTVGEFAFAVSAPWTEAQNTGMMTKAVLAHPVEGGTPLEAKFYYFGTGQGGDVDANVKRWIGQFEGTPEVNKEELDMSGTKVTLVTIHGTYLDGPPFGGSKTPRADYTMLGAILVGKDAPVFIKLTGPKKDAATVQENFKKLTASPFKK